MWTVDDPFLVVPFVGLASWCDDVIAPWLGGSLGDGPDLLTPEPSPLGCTALMSAVGVDGHAVEAGIGDWTFVLHREPIGFTALTR